MTDKKDDEITLDQNAQRALAYLSGIPSMENNAIVEVDQSISEKAHTQFQKMMGIWLRLQEDEIGEIGKTLIEVLQQIDLSKKKFRDRLESPAYHKLVRKSFRNWSAAESEDKRTLIRNLLINAVVDTRSPDYALSLFIDWLDRYSDEHFKIIHELFMAEPYGLSRYDIWHRLHTYQPGEDSAEADLFRMLILDLTTGHVIRQQREKDFHGQFIRAARSKQPSMSTAFEETKKYVLTELGKQFVAYTMEEQGTHEETDL